MSNIFEFENEHLWNYERFVTPNQSSGGKAVQGTEDQTEAHGDAGEVPCRNSWWKSFGTRWLSKAVIFHEGHKGQSAVSCWQHGSGIWGWWQERLPSPSKKTKAQLEQKSMQTYLLEAAMQRGSVRKGWRYADSCYKEPGKFVNNSLPPPSPYPFNNFNPSSQWFLS